MSLLKDVGFTEDELARAWNGQKDFSLRDHRLQMLIVDGVRYREMQEKARTVQAKQLPPVQRPGVSQPKGAANDAIIQNLSKQLDTATGMQALRIAAKLTAAKRQSAGR